MPDDSTPRICPRSGHPMTHHVIDDLHLDVCPSCGGVWYDAGQFTRLVNDGPKEADVAVKFEPPQMTAVQTDRKEMCPIDKIPLHPSLYKGHPGIEIATCYECAGIFMTAESLKALDKFEADHNGMPAAPQLSEEEIVDAATLDAQKAADVYRSKLAIYGWGMFDWHSMYQLNNLPPQ